MSLYVILDDGDKMALNFGDLNNWLFNKIWNICFNSGIQDSLANEMVVIITGKIETQKKYINDDVFHISYAELQEIVNAEFVVCRNKQTHVKNLILEK